MQAVITIGIKDLEPLRELHEEAVKNSDESFFYKGAELLTVYAGYLIEFLEMKQKQIFANHEN